MRSLALAAFIGFAACAAGIAQEAGEAYRTRLMLSGYLLRSSMACTDAQAKMSIDIAMRYASTGGVRDFTKAFPKTAEQWMRDGAGHFNDDVMSKGLSATCEDAKRISRQAP